MPLRRSLLGALLLSIAWFRTVGAAEPVPVTLESSGTVDTVTLSGFLYRPDGAGPFPAVIGLHGCSGLVGRDGRPFGTFRDWGERLSGLGYVLLYPDSFGGRSVAEVCTARERSIQSARERVQDAYAALRWLRAQPFVAGEAVALIGWSHGGSTALAALGSAHRERPADAGFRDFRAAIAFYPGCGARRLQEGWRTSIPLLILMGESDNWTPLAPCRTLAEAARGRGEPVEIVTYPGASHSFDMPGGQLHRRTGLAYTADGSGTATVGTDPAARADAIRRVPAYLAERLQPR